MTVAPRSPLTCAVACALAIAMGGSAYGHDAVYFWDSTGSTYKEISGTPNGKASPLDVQQHEVGIYSIAVREMRDEPCMITLHTNDLPGQTITPEPLSTALTTEGRFCSGTTREAKVSNNHFLTAIQVCTNGKESSQSRIKGIRVWGDLIGASGSLMGKESGEFKLPNCSEWANKVSCDTNQIITGLKGYSGGSGFSGIAIECSPLRTK